MPKQQGVTLLVALISLTLVMIVGTAAFHSAQFEARVENAKVDSQIALTTAESAIVEAEQRIQTQVLSFNDTNGLYDTPAGAAEEWRQVNWDNPNGTEVVIFARNLAGQDSRIARAPRYIIEQLPEPAGFISSQVSGFGTREKMEVYRITAEGTGYSQDLRRYLQVHYTRIVSE
ncbi:pilus assembly PilX family protein [Balneatrix alpica]|uniref:PilX/PilW C-terminal domain-containing protein n=1 Tax=Balneatrix alpica TaxID=75684 RepID=A0ABV5ZBJ2_9GAMM|nr:hypothetical protein [Balneatrix alpica]